MPFIAQDRVHLSRGASPVRMPRLCSAERLSESMVDEIFQKGAA